MIIREMVKSDLDEVVYIEQETFAMPWSKEDFCSALKDQNNVYLVVELQGTIAGYCGYWGIAGEGYIYNVVVRKEFRRQQIGYLMLKELIEHASIKGVTTFTLEVRCSNTVAIQLYERMGFVPAGIRKDFYTKPVEDAAIMWLNPIQ